MDKGGVVYIYSGILLSHEKEQNFAICSNMDGLGEHYAKSDRERQILFDITYMWNLKKIQQTSEYNKKSSRLTDTENKLVVTRGEREGGGAG